MSPLAGRGQDNGWRNGGNWLDLNLLTEHVLTKVWVWLIILESTINRIQEQLLQIFLKKILHSKSFSHEIHVFYRQCMNTILSNLQFWQGVHLVYNSAHPKPQLICVILYFCLYLHLQGMWCEIVPVGLAGAHDVFHKLIITKIQQQTRHQTPRSTKH